MKALEEHRDDHAKRISAVEKVIWGVAGSVAAISVVFGLFLDVLKDWIKDKFA